VANLDLSKQSSAKPALQYQQKVKLKEQPKSPFLSYFYAKNKNFNKNNGFSEVLASNSDDMAVINHQEGSKKESIKESIKRSAVATKAIALENTRQQTDANFLRQYGQNNGQDEVIITTRSINYAQATNLLLAAAKKAPSLLAVDLELKKQQLPILVFSCSDNITQMQIVLFEAAKPASQTLTLILDQKTSLKMDWFIRDKGYLLESSRGLPGISYIQKLFSTKEISIVSADQNLNGLSFNIKGLAEVILPLRGACRW